MAENPNVTTLKTCYSEWHETRGGSVDRWLSICHPNMTLTSAAMGRAGVEFTRPCSCLDDVRAYFTGLAADWTMDHLTVDRYVADGDTVIALGSTGWTSRRTGKSFDIIKSDCWIFRDGKAISFTEYYDSTDIVLALQG